jgi:hypothetical protein
VNLLQTWLILGVPLLIAAGMLFAGRSRTRAWLGYGVLAVLVLVFLLVPQGDVSPWRELSAGLVGSLAFAFVATGRGTHVDKQYLEHHVGRRRFTTTPHDS